MSDINTSLAAGTPRPTAGGSGGDTAVRVVDPSPDLARLATGDSLRGTVVGRDEHGHLQVRTRLGVLTLSVPRALPVGTEVVLQVRSVGPQVVLNLLPLNLAAGTQASSTAATPPAVSQAGQPGPLPAGPPQPGQAPPPSGAAAPLPANPSDLVQRGQLLRALLHAAPPLPSLAGLPAALPGSELAVRVLAVGVRSPTFTASTAPAAPSGGTLPPGVVPSRGAVPSTGVAPSAGSVPPAGSAPPGGLGSAVASPTATTGQSGLPFGGTPAATSEPMPAAAAPGLRAAPQVPVAVSGHSLATALQTASSEAAARAAGSPAAALPGSSTTPPGGQTVPPATAPLRLTALVTATTSSGQPILHTALGTLTLDTRAALPAGTSLALEVALPTAVREAAMAALPSAWPSVESLEESLFQGLPAVQAEAVARALPQVGPRLASGILFFLAALNQGTVGGWLAQAGGSGAIGEHGDVAGSLAERLAREFAGLARGVDTPTGEWRLVNLPLWSDAGLRELRCFYRHQHTGGRGADGDKATRFVLELELQRHGELQLDGLVRRQLFDLVLRSRRPLPALVRGDLLALFEETNAIAGYNGRLSFQASQDWMQLLAARGASEQHEGFRV